MSTGAALALIGFTMSALPTVSGLNLVYASVFPDGLTVPQNNCLHNDEATHAEDGRRLCTTMRSLGGFVGSTVTFMGITLETMPYLALIALSSFRGWICWSVPGLQRRSPACAAK